LLKCKTTTLPRTRLPSGIAAGLQRSFVTLDWRVKVPVLDWLTQFANAPVVEWLRRREIFFGALSFFDGCTDANAECEMFKRVR
jgi:hypothetical protein